MANKEEALFISEQINYLLSKKYLSYRLISKCPVELTWDDTVSEWNDCVDVRCFKELIENQDKFVSDITEIDDENYGVILSYKDSFKIDKLVEDICKNFRDFETGYNDVHTIDFFFFDNSSINIEVMEVNKKIIRVGTIGWFVDKDDKSYTDKFIEEFKKKLMEKLA